MIAKEEKVILVTENELEISLNEAFKLFSHKVRTLAKESGFEGFSPRIKLFLIKECLVYNSEQVTEQPTREDLQKYGELKEKVKSLVDNPSEYEKVNSYMIKVLGI